jgi:CRISPR-associated endonuclease/helicase Cas3
MNPLTVADFPTFFRDLWEHDPFPWQSEFARRICVGESPEYVAVPTGSGKTACLDAAVFALAVQSFLSIEKRTQGRRIFFIVNRRVIVDEAYERAGELCKKLRNATPDSVSARVAAALRSLSGGTTPLGRVQLRGGIYRDRSWAGALPQPMIICSTVDQAGSRLLFRGYGVSEQARPIHAALVAQDSMLIVDEAHISRPFIQTLDWVRRYREYRPPGSETVCLPFQFIQMTATPPAETEDAKMIALSDSDQEHPVLKPRLSGAKIARLITEPLATGKAREKQMAARLTKEAQAILEVHKPRSIAIMVNRVATARAVAEEMEKKHKGRVTLLIGRMRPLDREDSTRKIQGLLKTGAVSQPEDGPHIVVSTQCLEVGADLDFDALVTEAASLDALRQRFGRLNRAGREIIARAVIVLPGEQDLALDKLDDAAPSDPIYGNAIPRTWSWLQSIAQNEEVDFGINAMTSAVKQLRADSPDSLVGMLSPTSDAPVILPSYLDCWVQTNPAPAADPDVALFLHGPQRDMAEVHVCWRGDLPENEAGEPWTETLSLCSPTTLECLPVPLHVFRQWMNSRGEFKDSSGDAGETPQIIDRRDKVESRGVPIFIWRGPDESKFATAAADIHPGDTIVLRAQSGGWNALGHLPEAPDDPQEKSDAKLSVADIRRVDLAEVGIAKGRRLGVMRIHHKLLPTAEKDTAAATLIELSLNKDNDWTAAEIRDLLARLLEDESPGWPLNEQQRDAIRHLKERKLSELSVIPYPDHEGFVISSRVLMPEKGAEEVDTEDSDADALLEAKSSQAQELSHHTGDVLARIESSFAMFSVGPWRDALVTAAELHDWGKADSRFQALLRSTTLFAAMASGVVLAKSSSIPSSAAARRAASERAGLPKGFRHEMLSVQMAETEVGSTALPTEPSLRALVLHLIATHHGYGRPFAPVVKDDAPPDVTLPMKEKTVAITSEQRSERPSHALDSGIAERFWQMTRHHGWWGIAFLETIIRLADQRASAAPSTP